jgi:hypothetical protein
MKSNWSHQTTTHKPEQDLDTGRLYRKIYLFWPEVIISNKFAFNIFCIFLYYMVIYEPKTYSNLMKALFFYGAKHPMG